MNAFKAKVRSEWTPKPRKYLLAQFLTFLAIVATVAAALEAGLVAGASVLVAFILGSVVLGRKFGI